MAQILFITGTDTNVGKTVLSVLLTRELLRRGVDVRALKPLCSGGREDAEALLAAMGEARFQGQSSRFKVEERGHQEAALDLVNPWHFEEPLTPMIAARRAGKPLRQTEVKEFLERAKTLADVLLVEGAGGLLSPLGEEFDARDLIVALKATPVVVAPNRLGAINQALLVMEALPMSIRRRAQLVLMQPPELDLATKTNVDVLRERLGKERVHLLPRLDEAQVREIATARVSGAVTSSLRRLTETLGL